MSRQPAASLSRLCTALSLPCTGISIIITPTPALPLPGFALKSTASVWNKLRFSLFLQPPCEADDSLYQFVFCWSLEAFSRSLLCTLLTELFCSQRTHKLKLYGDTTGKLNGFGTERWTKRLEKSHRVLLRYSGKSGPRLYLDSLLMLA